VKVKRVELILIYSFGKICLNFLKVAGNIDLMCIL
ncbi:uncharacterized protein METZ01_LOCUS497423, partial [marine metagenome]